MKKVTFILASMLVVVLSGCGGGSSSSKSSNANVDNTPAGTETNAGNGVVKDVRGLTQFPAVPAVPES